MLWINASATSGEWPRMVAHSSFGMSLHLPADQAVGQGPQLLDQPDIVRARAKVERPLWHRSGRQPAGAGGA